MVANADRDFALAAIYENICALRLAAGQIYRARNFAVAAHLAIICGEECAKYLLVFCREHLSRDTFKRRYSHAPKYKVMSVPWHIAGSLSIVYLMVVAMREGILGGTPQQHDHIIDDLVSFVGSGNPVRVAETILKCLAQSDQKQELISRKSIELRERHRQAIYVDLDENYKIVGRPNDIDRQTAAQYIRDATVALAAINFLISERPDVDLYVQSLPRVMREERKKEATDFVNKFRKKIDAPKDN